MSVEFKKFQCNRCKLFFLEEWNCGGDCLWCMAECGDPECLKSVCEDGRKDNQIIVDSRTEKFNRQLGQLGL